MQPSHNSTSIVAIALYLASLHYATALLQKRELNILEVMTKEEA